MNASTDNILTDRRQDHELKEMHIQTAAVNETDHGHPPRPPARTSISLVCWSYWSHRHHCCFATHREQAHAELEDSEQVLEPKTHRYNQFCHLYIFNVGQIDAPDPRCCWAIAIKMGLVQRWTSSKRLLGIRQLGSRTAWKLHAPLDIPREESCMSWSDSCYIIFGHRFCIPAACSLPS